MWHVGLIQTAFIVECKLVFRSKQKFANTDYHGDVNAEVFKNLFMKLLHYAGTKLKNAAVVMDNKGYHSVLLSKAPTTSSRKYEVGHIYWLQKSNICHDSSHIRNELLTLVSVFKLVNKFYKLNKIAFSRGQTVIHLPLDNPVELILTLS
jgi:hypothetical protein